MLLLGLPVCFVLITSRHKRKINANNGAWLRAGTFNKGIANQSSIDLSPAVNKALGWVYPSSGLIKVNVSGLP
ncbi:MAG TPA: hypothetical protein VIX20_07930 [Ktedonobacteraceae bacterium]